MLPPDATTAVMIVRPRRPSASEIYSRITSPLLHDIIPLVPLIEAVGHTPTQKLKAPPVGRLGSGSHIAEASEESLIEESPSGILRSRLIDEDRTLHYMAPMADDRIRLHKKGHPPSVVKHASVPARVPPL
jgi:hypothetical protein